eukprot:GEMP01017422.1.p1 GENE.GEMP01017422.1~~GEMP01017422.1.p1  ORF type:complete len:659 (+),score=165.40 GEMP01017422.1:20-1996(+)
MILALRSSRTAYRGLGTFRALKSVKSPVPPDFEVASSVKPLPIARIGKEAGLLPDEIEPYGKGLFGKLDSTAIMKRLKDKPLGSYVLVAGVTPTPLGEGKSTVSVGLSQALGHLNKRVFTCIRQPSMGPTFGIKGGAAGGGYAQVIPMDDFNLHLTGDIHAISIANNLVFAAINARMFHEGRQSDKPLFLRLTEYKDASRGFSESQKLRLKNLGIAKTDPADFTPEEMRRFARLDIDPATVTVRPCVDVNDRILREVEIGLGEDEIKTPKGVESKTDATRRVGFDITVASELMAIVALATSVSDLRKRVGQMVIGLSRSGEAVTCEDLGVAGAVTILLKEAIKPTIMQTLEGTPVLVHAGPFANIAHGNSSVIADQVALRLVGPDGFVITEAGFGADIGGEKFLDIKCRASGLAPDVAVLVCTVRSQKMHGGGPPVLSGKPLAREYKEEHTELVAAGSDNMKRHIEALKKFGIPVIVALNQFVTDTPAEIEVLRQKSLEAGAEDLVVAAHFTEGGAGAKELAQKVIEVAAKKEAKFKYLYDLDISVKDKIHTIVTEIYGGRGVTYSEEAEEKIKAYTALGYDNLPICMAKTPLSFTGDPSVKGAPTGFTIHIRDIKASVGAGFLYPLVGDIRTMPGLPTRPAFYDVDIDEEGQAIGLF